MFAGLYYLLFAELAAFLLFLILFEKYTSTFVKILTTILFVGAAVLLATNDEGSSHNIEPGRFWGSVALTVLTILINGIVGASNKDTIK